MSYDATLRLRRFFRGVPNMVDTVGEQALFYGESVRYIPNALTRGRLRSASVRRPCAAATACDAHRRADRFAAERS